jgi:hypothetical protein
MENYSFLPSELCGFAYYGWLMSYHVFSFTTYFNEKRVHFRGLTLHNDDALNAGAGFGNHLYVNGEIVNKSSIGYIGFDKVV